MKNAGQSFSQIFDERYGENALDRFERIAAVFHDETGYLRPGKDCVIHDPETRRAAWEEWYDNKRDAPAQPLLTPARQ